MKLLLLTDCPPCQEYTGGVFLDHLMRFLPKGSVVCFAVVNRQLDIEMRLSSDLDWIPIEYAEKPQEYNSWGAAEEGASQVEIEAAACLIESTRRTISVPILVERAVEFARSHDVDAVLAVLEGQTVVGMALPVANELRVPLYTMVWDPISWWMKENRIDQYNRALYTLQFDETVRRSKACGVASWAMADEYTSKYLTRCVPIVQGLDVALSEEKPRRTVEQNDKFVLGMVGQFYALEEWRELIKALDDVEWSVSGRNVTLLTFGRSEPPGEIAAERIDFRGWLPPVEIVKLLAQEADALYCPYPFSSDFAEVARLSFPSKLSLYLASGRPVIFHGPGYSSPATYLKRFDAALMCGELDGLAIVRAIAKCIQEPSGSGELARRGKDRFCADFTIQSMRSSFLELLNADANPNGENVRFAPACPERPSSEHSNVTVLEASPDLYHARLSELEARLHSRYRGLIENSLSALEKFGDQNRDLRKKVNKLQAEANRLGTLIAEVLDEKRNIEAARDHLTRHQVALEATLVEARSRDRGSRDALASATNELHFARLRVKHLEERFGFVQEKHALLERERDLLFESMLQKKS